MISLIRHQVKSGATHFISVIATLLKKVRSQKPTSYYAYEKNIFRKGKLFLKPNSSTWFGRVVDGEINFSHKISINNFGFRDDLPYTKRANDEVRIATIGDSFTANFDSPKCWPNILEQILTKKKRKPIKVFNLGLPGAGPSNWIGLNPIIDELLPDIIIFNFYDGILNRAPIRFSCSPTEHRFYCLYGNSKPFLRPVGIYDKHFSKLQQSDLQTYGQHLKNENEALKKAPSFYSKHQLHEKIHDSRSLLGRNLRLLNTMLSWAPKIVFTTSPAMMSLNDESRRESKQYKGLLKLSSDNKIPFLDFDDTLSEYKKEQIYMESAHWNSLGNQIVAESMANFIIPYIDTVKPVTPSKAKRSN